MGDRSVITLLTDFGTTDSYVAEVKGVLLSGAPDAMLVDVTHEIPQGDIRAAQVILGRTWHRFPPGTVHLCVVDPGVGTARQAVALASGGHQFVGPDNGLFTDVSPDGPPVALTTPEAAAPTFHARDVFAPAAAALARRTALTRLGPPARPLVRTPLPASRMEGGCLVGEVLLADRFGNLITNLDAGAAGAGHVRVGGVDVGPVRRTFGDVPAGTLVAYVGSGGTIEIAVRDGSAATRLAATRATDVRVEPD